MLLHPPGDGEAFLVFTPPSVAMSLPLQHRFAARGIVEAHVFSDQFDARPFALQLLAVARFIAGPDGATSAKPDRAGSTP
jgi:hypothetical protein